MAAVCLSKHVLTCLKARGSFVRMEESSPQGKWLSLVPAEAQDEFREQRRAASGPQPEGVAGSLACIKHSKSEARIVEFGNPGLHSFRSLRRLRRWFKLQSSWLFFRFRFIPLSCGPRPTIFSRPTTAGSWCFSGDESPMHTTAQP